VIARPLPRQRSGHPVVWTLLIVAFAWVVDHAGQPASPHPSPSAGAHPPGSPGVRPLAGLTFTNGAGCQPGGDYASPRLDRRVRQLLVAIAARHRVRVSCLRTGHSWYVKGTDRVSNHTVSRAVDVDQVDGQPVRPSNAAARELALWIGRGQAGVRPSELGSPWDVGGRPWFTNPGHQDHLHVGFPAPTQAGGGW
jgi:hypothetical protein